MTLSRKIGSLIPIWNLSPLVVAITIIALDFGLINLLMAYPEGWFYRPRWLSFIIGDAFFLPLVFFGLATRLRQTKIPKNSWFSRRPWHIGVLLMGFIISIALELVYVISSQVTLAQELSPSKLAHTFIFALVFYLIFSVLPFLHHSRAPKWSAVICIIGILGMFTCNMIDNFYTSQQYGTRNLLPVFDWKTGSIQHRD